MSVDRWPSLPLGDVCDINPRLPRDGRPAEDTEVTFVPMAAVDETTASIAAAEIRAYSAVKKGFTPFLDNDVLFAKITPCMENGKIALARGLTNGLGFGSTEFHVLRASSRVLPEWLRYFVLRPTYRAQAKRRMTGAGGQQRVPAKFLAASPVPLPPVPEQRRLVDLLSRAENIVRMRREADAKAREIIPTLFLDMFGRDASGSPVALTPDPTTLPAGWRWSRLMDVARLATGHTPSRRVSEYWDGGDIPWITLTDIRALDGKVAIASSQLVTQKGIDNSSAVVLPKGTVCFSRTASVGFVTVMGRDMCTSQDFVNWVCGDKLESMYLMSALMQSREYLRSLASGSTHKTIYFPTVEQFHVLLPPIALQRQFARHVGDLLALAGQNVKATVVAGATFQSLLEGVFREAS